jgi:hypothetical protein
LSHSLTGLTITPVASWHGPTRITVTPTAAPARGAGRGSFSTRPAAEWAAPLRPDWLRWDPYGDLELVDPLLVEDIISTLALSVADTA